MAEVVIKVDHLAKSYRVFKKNIRKIQYLVFGQNTGRNKKVLKDVSFEIEKGERVAIIGRYAKGKTTLLKLLCGIIEPDKGTIEVSGEVTPILNFKVGFELNLPIDDNYVIAATLRGWDKQMIDERREEILEFAGLEKVRTRPIKEFKGAPANKLGLAIATYDEPEILITDEKFMLGHKASTEKCVDHVRDLLDRSGATFIMSGNRAEVAKKLCTRGIVLEKGVVAFDGPYEEAAAFLDELKMKYEGKTKEQMEKEERGDSEPEGETYSDDGDDDGMDM